MDAAIKELQQCDKPNISRVSERISEHRSTLSRRFNGVTNSLAEKAENQSILSHQQERTLSTYITKLTLYGIPPTPSMVRNLVFDISKVLPARSWVSRFIKRHPSLDSRYLNPLDKSRKKADSYIQYEAYFNIIQEKVKKYRILPQNMYNMDEKGFMVGVLQKAKRVFTRLYYENKLLLGPLQDGNREWITVIACICADLTSLPPAIIYKAITGNVQSSWVQDMELDQDTAFVASSPNGWTDNHLGLQWLQQVFDRYTKDKAGPREWRLLFIDGHGSHVSMPFLDYCLANRILLAVYPPHSTHRLQPLDVSLFAPLGVFYSQELERMIHHSMGFSSVAKRDFFRLFTAAYKKAFSEKNIGSGWRKTGLWPFEPMQVLVQLKVQQPQNPSDIQRPYSQSSSTSVVSDSDWRKLKTLVRQAVSEADQSKVQRLENQLLHLQTQNQLLKAENHGLKETFNNEKKKRQRAKPLFEIPKDQPAQFYSPSKIATGKAVIQAKEQAKADKQAEKTRKAISAKVAKQLKAKEQQIARQEREVTKASKAAKKERQKEDQQVQKQVNELLQASVRKPARKPRKQQAAVAKQSLVVVLKVRNGGFPAAPTPKPFTRLTLRQRLQAA